MLCACTSSISKNSQLRSIICNGIYIHIYYYYYRYSALGLVWAETRAQPGDWYGSGMLHPGQIFRGSLPLLSLIYMYMYMYTHTHTHTYTCVLEESHAEV
jgi:hypothetical protein